MDAMGATALVNLNGFNASKTFALFLSFLADVINYVFHL
jgi:hypothetical protein